MFRFSKEPPFSSRIWKQAKRKKKTVDQDGVPNVSVITEQASRRTGLQIRDPEGLLAVFPGTAIGPSGPWTGASLSAEAGGSGERSSGDGTLQQAAGLGRRRAH